jgi:3-dehydro-L-gulonate 2-dehydrogenase
MIRIPFDEVRETLGAVLRKLGFTAERAALCARLFAETTCDGVYTHGIERFPRLVAMIGNGEVDAAAEPEVKARLGAIERWDGRRGPGNLNAWAAMERAMALAREQGMGCVALGNTNHWMRGGTYGWQAAAAGCIGICWTNTMPNLPAWGGTKPVVGNNPLVFAVPRAAGAIVLDMAVSQFSMGALAAYRKRGELLPVAGGFDAEGHLTRDPAAIEQSQRMLPVGFWKGSGLAIVLDAIAAMLSLGMATHQIPPESLREAGLSQLFIAIDPRAVGEPEACERIADGIVASLDVDPAAPVRYPGEKTLETRAENLRLGLPADPELWRQIQAMAR